MSAKTKLFVDARELLTMREYARVILSGHPSHEYAVKCARFVFECAEAAEAIAATPASKFPSVEEHLATWASQDPSLRVHPAELEFIAAMRRAAAQGVGYGFMRQIVGVEWKHFDPIAGVDDEVIRRLERERIAEETKA